MQGSLFTRDFLLEGIAGTLAWVAVSDVDIDAFHTALKDIFAAFPIDTKPNESVTEDDLIFPVLDLLGWNHRLTQQSATRKGREDVPDVLLFADSDTKAIANRERKADARYRHGLAIVENKAWSVPLDRGPPDLFNQDAPSTQMLRYLTRVEIASDRRIQWGILTNGRYWRLYFQGARSRAEEFLELDLPLLLGIRDIQAELFSPPADKHAHLLKVFLLMFRRAAFLPQPDDAHTFHQIALDISREWEARVSQDLSDVVFDTLYPALTRALHQADPAAPRTIDAAYLDHLRRSALTLLYRLLFVLYAEDRNLLPAHDPRYDGYSLTQLRKDIRDRVDRRDHFSARATDIYGRLKTVFRLIDAGDPSLGLPPYNGGLFDRSAHALLERADLPDQAIAPIIDALSRRTESDGHRKWINYRDLSVQHLGSIYERLLEYAVAATSDGKVDIRLNPFARKGSGSYYTHEDLVHLIIERAVGPLVDECVQAFEAKSAALAKARTPKAERPKQLADFDPATAILELKVCDPAMGSGHFLVSLVDYLADEILEAMADASMLMTASEPDFPYRSPLAARIDSIRTQIQTAANREGWIIPEGQLDDRHIVRRMILKRVIYGVDKNPMAVELAKVALWLHTFTVGAPLSFLDHHLRCGDSLFGEWVRPVEDMLAARSGLFMNQSVAKAKASARGMLDVEALTDADIAEVKESRTKFAGVEEATAPLARFMDIVHALRWLAPEDREDKGAIQAFYQGDFGDPVAIVNGWETAKGKGAARVAKLLHNARALATEQRFMHWEVAFPGVWIDWESREPTGGFDAVIGNPPWDRMKLQEVEWFAARRLEIAKSVRASDRKKMIAALEKSGDPLWDEYTLTKERAEQATAVARDIGDYPLLSGGDVNIYSLFVERAHRLIYAKGAVGLLVPSGLASDLGASPFFRSIATAGRLGTLFDFENRWPTYFPDVDSRFKFSIYVGGGSKRKFDRTECAFFLNGLSPLADPERRFELSAEDFTRVNPNTGTAPVFRTRRDAEITRAIYAGHPVLVQHVGEDERRVWPVSYLRMFDMTNDAALFKTCAELERAGFYAVAGNRLKKGNTEYRPLYEGKMVQAYDHRAASVIVNRENLNRPAQPESATLEQHCNADWTPTPQFWIDTTELIWPEHSPNQAAPQWTLGFKDVTAPTNVRTMIAAAVPCSGIGNTLPVLFPNLPPEPKEKAGSKAHGIWRRAVGESYAAYIAGAPLLLATLNSFSFDYLARQKVQGQHLNWYIIEQIPVIPPATFEKKIGKTTIADFVRGEVLRLTYTAHDMAPFARDMGYEGPPFVWDEDDRRHRRARLDALFFQLYGIGAEDAAYILDTFPIVREQDEAAVGLYLTKDLVLGYMRAIAAGDLTSRISP